MAAAVSQLFSKPSLVIFNRLSTGSRPRYGRPGRPAATAAGRETPASGRTRSPAPVAGHFTRQWSYSDFACNLRLRPSLIT